LVVKLSQRPNTNARHLHDQPRSVRANESRDAFCANVKRLIMQQHYAITGWDENPSIGGVNAALFVGGAGPIRENTAY
jgi:hypothetical protein